MHPRFCLLPLLLTATLCAQSAQQPRLSEEELSDDATPPALAAHGQARNAAQQEASASKGGSLIYRSPSGLFSMPVPVYEELGGTITEDRMFVHFSDAFTTHISVVAVEMDSTQRLERAVREPREFLTKAFSTLIMPQFRTSSPDVKADKVLLLPKFMEGALYVGTLHPGHSNFLQRTFIAGLHKSDRVGRRGTLVFSRGGYLFVVSSELGEKATEGSLHALDGEKENEILKNRLLALVRGMHFTLPADEPAAAPPQGTP